MEQTQEQTVRRVCSMPIRQSPAARSYSNTPIQSPNPENIDLLFTHPSCKIVSFNTASYSSFPSPTSASYSSSFSSCTLNEDRDLLPFTSSCERTLASGLLRLYRSKPHNIAFIHSGSILHPVLAKSQCWCVDEARGIFCLRIRPGSYWRIEISELQGESFKIAQFKLVLAQVLGFEIAPCPFTRVGMVPDPVGLGILGGGSISFGVKAPRVMLERHDAYEEFTSSRPASRRRPARPSLAMRITRSRAASPQLTEANVCPFLSSIEGRRIRSCASSIRTSSAGPSPDLRKGQRAQGRLEIVTDFTQEEAKTTPDPPSFSSTFSSFPSLSPDDGDSPVDVWEGLIPPSGFASEESTESSSNPLGTNAHKMGTTMIRSSSALLSMMLSFPGKVAAGAIKGAVYSLPDFSNDPYHQSEQESDGEDDYGMYVGSERRATEGGRIRVV